MMKFTTKQSIGAAMLSPLVLLVIVWLCYADYQTARMIALGQTAMIVGAGAYIGAAIWFIIGDWLCGD